MFNRCGFDIRIIGEQMSVLQKNAPGVRIRVAGQMALMFSIFIQIILRKQIEVISIILS
jgi:hypothetical protein